ncbi:hypothetical protein A9Q78_11415 [Methylophaga sp. 41_12_T18]|nr:hypothetical protein A9Q78_11415 [Methylophaga sp. 41_12_T18]
MITINAIETEQCQIIYRQSPIFLVVTILLMLLIDSYYWDKVSSGLLMLWSTAVIALTIVRLMMVKRFNRQAAENEPRRWLFKSVIASFISGVLWGICLLFIISPILNIDALLITLILTGMAAGSLVPLSTYLANYYAFSIPTLFPLAIFCYSQSSFEFFLSGILVTIFLVAMLGFSLLVNRNVIETIKLRFENVDLLENFKKQKELAEKANIDKSRFLAATSHDLRQPLHALDLYLGALTVKISDDEHLELLNKMRASSHALSDLLNALMDMSRLDSAEVDVHNKQCSLSGLLLSICHEYEQQAAERNIEIKSSIAELTVYTDPVLLARMLRNLISNAIKHNQDCKVTISLAKQAGVAKIKIIDDGIGIAEDELSNIFSEFYQLNNPERDRTKGLGLGLAIVKRLSSLLNIPLSVDSKLGRGTQFSLSLATSEIELEDFSAIENVEQVDLVGKFIMVIDDEYAVRDSLKALLRSWQCEVLMAADEQELMTMIQTDNYPSPDLIISDYRLRNNVTGIEVITTVRQFYKQTLPVLIVTGDSSQTINDEVARNDCQLILKPVASNDLKAIVKQLVS